MRKIDYFELGATLYVPIMHKNLEFIVQRKKYTHLKSIVICLEDSTALSDMDEGMRRLSKILEEFCICDLKVFIRPRNIENLKDILKFKNIDRVDGFALPKFDTTNIEHYLSIFIEENRFCMMPILETKDVFSSAKLYDILKELQPFKEKILVIRVGGEDILSLLHTLRDCHKTLYEIMPLYLILSSIINIFRPNGFYISSTVYACYGEGNRLEQELLGDKEHQLFNKTCIHPRQVPIIERSYQVTHDELVIAQRLLEEEGAIFSYNSRMYEKATHSNWAKSIMKRYKIYGETDKGSTL